MENQNGSSPSPKPLQLQEEKRAKPGKQKSCQTGHFVESLKTAEAVNKEREYVSGFKLSIAMTSVTLVAFLMMLDMSIIATVSQ